MASVYDHVSKLENIDLTKTKFWVQIHNLPFLNMSFEQRSWARKRVWWWSCGINQRWGEVILWGWELLIRLNLYVEGEKSSCLVGRTVGCRLNMNFSQIYVIDFKDTLRFGFYHPGVLFQGFHHSSWSIHMARHSTKPRSRGLLRGYSNMRWPQSVARLVAKSG